MMDSPQWVVFFYYIDRFLKCKNQPFFIYFWRCSAVFDVYVQIAKEIYKKTNAVDVSAVQRAVAEITVDMMSTGAPMDYAVLSAIKFYQQYIWN